VHRMDTKNPLRPETAKIAKRSIKRIEHPFARVCYKLS
jgi:hypothetical protein